MKRGFTIFIIDAIILIISFFFLVYLKYNSIQAVYATERTTIYFLLIWLVISSLAGKYNIKKTQSTRETYLTIAFANLMILGLSVILIRISKPFVEFRFLILYSIFVATGIEFILSYLYLIIFKAISSPFSSERISSDSSGTATAQKVRPGKTPALQQEQEIAVEDESVIDLSSIIVEETDRDTFNFIRNYFSPRKTGTLITSTTTVFNIYNQPRPRYDVIINLTRINDFQYINKFFEAVNAKLDCGGIFIDWVETYSQRKKRILKRYPWGLNYLIYTIDFIFKRVFPKINLTKKLYFLITRGRNRVISKAETFGRLYSCGFEIVEERFINDRLFFVFRKVQEPLFDYHPTYGPLIKLPRVGKKGEIIGVFKLRTMHAYSEYLQGYIYEKHSLGEGGKFKDDFRVTTLGRIFRALWIDELPMLINVFILRNMKIVGVRPLSEQYFSLYSDEMKERRTKFKPGLVPPYYAQFPTPKTLDEIQENERKYLEDYEKNRFLTDTRYFFKAFYNILFRKARSK